MQELFFNTSSARFMPLNRYENRRLTRWKVGFKQYLILMLKTCNQYQGIDGMFYIAQDGRVKSL